MQAYVVSFFNHLCGGAGFEQRVCQKRIVVWNASSLEEAVGMAKERFAREEGVGDWGLHACEIEARPVGEGERLTAES
jgi:hypothetical protein